MRNNNRELRFERSALLKEARLLSDKGRLTPSEQTKFNDLMRRADELKEEFEEIEGRMSGAAIRGGMIQTETREEPEDREYRQAFGGYLRAGLANMPTEQRSVLERRRAPAAETRDMITGGEGAYPSASTGFFVPVGFIQDITETLKTTGPLLDPSLIQLMDTASGNLMPYPSVNDVAVTGELVGEGQQVTDIDVALGMTMINAWKFSSRLVKVSIELVTDSAFNLEAFLIDAFAKRLGRSLNSYFTTGTGSAQSQPMGLLTSVLANGTVIQAVGSSPNDGTSAGANTLGSDDLTNLIHGIDSLYRAGASFLMNDTTLATLRRTKDKYGRPLLDPNVQDPAASSFLGFKILVDNYLPTLQTRASSPAVTVYSTIFGDLKRFLVRRVRDMSVLVLRERFADWLCLSPAV